MDKMNIKKLLCLLVVVSCLTATLWGYSSFFGNPISKYLANQQIKNYLVVNYPDKDFGMSSSNYNYKTGSYGARIIFKKEGISFFVSADARRVNYDQYKNEYIRDYEIEKIFAEQVKNRVLPILQKEVDEVVDMDVEMYIEQRKYSRKASYFEDVNEPLKIYVDLRSVNTKKISQEQFIEKFLKIREALLTMNLNIEYLDCYYMYKYKGDGYSMGLNKTEFNLSRQQLIDSDNVVDYETINNRREG